MEPADILRLVVLGGGTFLLGFAVAVMVEARKFRAPPRHVVTIAISYGLLVTALQVEIAGRFGSGFTWRVVIGAFSFAFGIYAMQQMWRSYKYATRLQRHEQKAITAGNELMKKAFRGEE